MIKHPIHLLISVLALSQSLIANAENTKDSISQVAIDNYATYCSACHGDQGNGDGPLTNTFEIIPIPHRHSAYVRDLPNDYLFKLLRDGGPSVGKSELMAPWKGTLSDQQINELIFYLKELAKPS